MLDPRPSRFSMGEICDEAISQDGSFEELKPLVDRLNSCPNLDPDFRPSKLAIGGLARPTCFTVAPHCRQARAPDTPQTVFPFGNVMSRGRKQESAVGSSHFSTAG